MASHGPHGNVLFCTWICLFMLPFTIAQSNCDEWVLSEGSQYCFQAIQGTNSKSECESLCTRRGAKLPLVTSEPVNQALTNLIAQRRLVEVWLGLTEYPDTWHWLDDLTEVAGQGCYLDNNEDEDSRDFERTFDIEDGVTIESCSTMCYNNGYQYCGLQGSDTCWCGNTFGRYELTTECNLPCVANYSQICGGILANQVYSTTGVYSDWGSDQPNNHLFYQACGMADYTLQYRWNDATCSERNGALCEIVMAESDCTGLYMDGRCIVASGERSSWFDWNYRCQAVLHGRLLHIRSATEANALKHYIDTYIANNTDVGLGNKTSFWLNLAQKRWEWFTGERILYNNWVVGKPNGWNLPCATIKEDGYWFDIDCSLYKGCLCQIDNASHIVIPITRPPPPPAPTTTTSTTIALITTTVASTPFFSLQRYGQWIILAGGILFFLILAAIIICQLRLWKKRKDKKVEEYDHFYGMANPNGPSSVTSGETTQNGTVNMLGSWEIPALTEQEEEARIKAKQNSSMDKDGKEGEQEEKEGSETEEGETGVSYATEGEKTEQQQEQEATLLF